MAKLSANGASVLLETEPTDWEDLSEGRRDHLARTSYVLRSDGVILRRDSFKIVYSSGPNGHSSSLRIVARFPKGTETMRMVDAFARYVSKRGHNALKPWRPASANETAR